jgi:hypothetical protein
MHPRSKTKGNGSPSHPTSPMLVTTRTVTKARIIIIILAEPHILAQRKRMQQRRTIKVKRTAAKKTINKHIVEKAQHAQPISPLLLLPLMLIH